MNKESILVIGANGYVGAKIYTDLKQSFPTTGTYHTNALFPELIHLDITDAQEVKNVFRSVRPTVVVHVANHADPRWCETHPEETYAVNITATTPIIEEANEYNATLIYISGAVAALRNGVYANSKYEADELVKTRAKDYLIIKPHTVIGMSPNQTADRMMNRFLKNLREGTPAQYDATWKFQPTYLHHMSQVIERCIKSHITNTVIPVVVPKLVTRYMLASDILSPLGVPVSKTETADMRPSIEETTKQLKHFQLPEYTYEEMIRAVIHEVRQTQ